MVIASPCASVKIRLANPNPAGFYVILHVAQPENRQFYEAIYDNRRLTYPLLCWLLCNGGACKMELRELAADRHLAIQGLGRTSANEERLLRFGDCAFDDLELLELTLQLVVGYRAAHMAPKLMSEFGSFSAVFAGSVHRLRKMGLSRHDIAGIRTVRAAAIRFGWDRVDKQQPILASWGALVEYCRVAMAFEVVEQLRILFLDKKSRLIADEVHQTGTVDHSPVYSREVIKRTLELSAMAIILVHNHPSGDPLPSSADVRMTREIADIAASMGITLYDHIIIGRSGCPSSDALAHTGVLINGEFCSSLG